MTRTPPSGTGEHATLTFLVELLYYDGANDVYVRLTTASQPITYDADGDGTAETYEAAGQLLEWGGERETTDQRGQGTRLKMSGVDQSIISTLMHNDFRGRRCRIWRASLDPSSGNVTEAYLVHRGLQLEDYEIREHVPEDAQDPVTAEITTRSTSRMVALEATNAVKANKRSHNAMLARAGLATGDTGLFYTTQLPGRIFWGTDQPDEALSGANAGASAGTAGGSGGGGWTGGGGGPKRAFR